MSEQESRNHFLLVTFHGQSHINPALEFAKRLIHTGAQVTLITTISGQRHILNQSTGSYPDGLIIAPFSDGYDDDGGGFKRDDNVDVDEYMTEFSRRGSEAVSSLVEDFIEEGCPITCLIYTSLVPWAGKVAHMFQLSSALLWIQPATLFDVYYYYFFGYKELILDNINDPSYSVHLPGLPSLRAPDLPTYLLPSNAFSFGIKYSQVLFQILSQEPKSFAVLVNTFNELEAEALKAVDEFNLIGIGPLIPSAFLCDKKPSNNPVESSEKYMEWLNSRENSSVVYVSFGSVAVLCNKQMSELARALVDSGRPFLWAIQSSGSEDIGRILCEEHKGIVVPWCAQVEALDHASIACFISHCGCNSTLEALAMGVPVVAVPQWADQTTNAKLIEDVWKVGVRVRPNVEDNIVRSEEFVRCVEQVMEGEKAEELRCNAKKWKDLSRQAVQEGGASDTNLRAFVDKFRQVV